MIVDENNVAFDAVVDGAMVCIKLWKPRKVAEKETNICDHHHPELFSYDQNYGDDGTARRVENFMTFTDWALWLFPHIDFIRKDLNDLMFKEEGRNLTVLEDLTEAHVMDSCIDWNETVNQRFLVECLRG